MTIARSHEFVSVVEKSGLVPDELLEEMRATITDEASDPKILARKLVHEKLLTRWQAEQLLAGRHGLQFGKYKLITRIARGGMGSIYQAEEAGSGRQVALKVMSRKLLEDPESVARFKREMKAALALRHPNIVRAYDAGRISNTYFIVMEYVDARDLSRWLDEFGRMPIEWTCECIRQAALGLQYAHEQGMVHRDIKPSNLLVAQPDPTRPPHLWILDMGLARFAGDGASETGELTQTGQIMGTPDYISPEQARNTKTADTRADIFSLGCTMFRMLTGELPFEGENAMEKLANRFSHDAPLASASRADIPTRLDLIIARMLARDREKRYQTPGEVADALQAFTVGSPDEWDEDSSINLPLVDPGEEDVQANPDPGLREFMAQMAITETLDQVNRARRRRLILLGALLLVLAGATAGWLGWQEEIRQRWEGLFGTPVPQEHGPENS